MDKNEYNKDEARLSKAIFGAVVIGLFTVALYDWLHKFEGFPVAILWAFACIACGGVIGFLFGVPRVVPIESDKSVVVNEAGNSNQNSHRLSINTNIEQISDWLTKIIVGLGLVNLGKLPDYLHSAASSLSKAIGSYGNGPHAFASALIIYFLLVGFIAGYLLTRLYISRLLITADNQVVRGYENGFISYANIHLPNELKNVVSEKEFKDILAETPLAATSNKQPSEKVAVTSRKLSDLNENEISDPVTLVAWATALYNLGNYTKAIEGYKKAITTFPNDPKLRFQYALALHASKNYKEAIKELEKANSLVSKKGDKLLKSDIVSAITFVYLYIDPPTGFEKCIDYGEKYVSDPNLPQNASIWINLAAAYGQKASFSKSHDGNHVMIDEVRNKALNAMQQALILDHTSAATFKTLLQSDIPKPKEENDLEFFEKDNEFRKLLGLSPINVADERLLQGDSH